MTFNFTDLGKETRELMQDELVTDINKNQLYLSTRFNQKGIENWAEYLSDAIADHDEDWLSEKLMDENVFDEYEMRATGRAGVPVNAAQIFAQTEFNRFYMRAICRKAIDSNSRIIIYRAKHSNNPRPDSENKIGNQHDPNSLWEDLRANRNVETFFGTAGPNSGLSIKTQD